MPDTHTANVRYRPIGECVGFDCEWKLNWIHNTRTITRSQNDRLKDPKSEGRPDDSGIYDETAHRAEAAQG